MVKYNFDINKVRSDFPSLSGECVFLDTAASSQKPQCVIDKMDWIYKNSYANVHRGSYKWAETITIEFENSREIVKNFINAKSKNEVIWTRNATEAINLVATCWGQNLNVEDEVLLSRYEHHANLVPWQVLAESKKFTIKFFNESNFEEVLTPKTKLVAVTGMSNVLGNCLDIQTICQRAHNIGAKVLIDGCQMAVHKKIDVQKLDCDFLVFSGHKTYGPTGIGVLYGKEEILNSMPPYQYGGDMVNSVSYQSASFKNSPARFEAGTPAIVEAIGLGSALEYMQNLGLENIEAYEKELSQYTIEELSSINGLKLISKENGLFCFDLCGIHASDVAFLLNKYNIAIRTGHHCAQPLVNSLGYDSLARASLGIYNTKTEIDYFVESLNKIKTFF